MREAIAQYVEREAFKQDALRLGRISERRGGVVDDASFKETGQWKKQGAFSNVML